MTSRTSFALTALLLLLAACGGSTSNDEGGGVAGSGGQGGGAGSAGTGGSAGSAGSGGSAGSSGGAGHAGSGGGPSCTSDSDCPVPAMCQVCPDGVTTSCATGNCVAGSCEVTYPPCPSFDGGGACPADVPMGSACTGDLHCEYGVETCCGHTFPSTFCDCLNGSFVCQATDACMMPPDMCPDGGPPPVPCGGFAGTPCPGNGTCVYTGDPTPDTPGQCECDGGLVDCMPGKHFDGSPAVCACVD